MRCLEKINSNPIWLFIAGFAGIFTFLRDIINYLSETITLHLILKFSMLETLLQKLIIWFLQFACYLLLIFYVYKKLKSIAEKEIKSKNQFLAFLSSLPENELSFLIKGSVIQNTFIANSNEHILYKYQLNREIMKKNKGYTIFLPLFVKHFSLISVKIHLNGVLYYAVIKGDNNNEINSVNGCITITPSSSFNQGFIELVIFLKEEFNPTLLDSLEYLLVTLEQLDIAPLQSNRVLVR